MLLQIAPQARSVKAQANLDPDLLIVACRVRARRRWILRAAATLIVPALVLVLLVCIRRDRMTTKDSIRSLERPLAALQLQVDRLGQLPASVPDVPARLQLVYAPDLVREYAQHATGPVIIGASSPHQLILGDEGHPVLLYENGKVRCEWWARTQFVRELHAQEGRVRQWNLQRRTEPPQLP